MKGKANLKEFATYTSLNVLGMIGLSCYILADTFFVAQGLGTDGLAALNLAIPVFNLIHGSGLMIGMGGATQYAILKSQNDFERADRAFTSTVFMALAFSAVLFVTGLFLSGTITAALGADKDVFGMCQTYVKFLLLFAPLFIINNIMLCFVRNDGAPQLVMFAMIASSFSNIVLDYIFIFPMNMGIFGAVLATGFAPVISLLVLLIFFIQRKNSFHFKKSAIPVRVVGGILSCGVPYLITELASGVVMIVFNLITMRLAGNIGVAAYGIIANISIVVISIFTGVAQGIQPIISRLYGAGNRTALVATLGYALKLIVILSAVIYALVFFGADPIAAAFNSTQNVQMQRIATSGLKIYFTSCVFAGVNIIISAYFAAMERARPAYLISLLRGFVIILPTVFLLSAIWGITGVWCALPMTEASVSLVALALYYFKRPL
ncbi:MATE family efflux transporter [Oscillospiraceae bacterium LTW-04]|nr:MATE family efflux transporter [Oscillospiraceae bacterium MB24-C1]